MTDRMITFNVRRFDGERTFNQEYVIPYEKNTLLGCLTKIREEQDASLCFTSACRHAICGSCAVQVNGNAYLACETQLDTLLDTFETDELFLEPLNNLPVVRDLVVNFDGISDKMRKVSGWMCPHAGRHDHLQTPEEFHLISKPADCVLCGSCISECRELAYDDGTYLPPAMMNKAYRFERDSRDGNRGERVLAALENNLWKCIHCQQCSTKCPKHIPVAEEISYLRRRALAMGQKKSEGARHAYSFYDDVKRTGMLNETMLALRTEGMVKTAVNRTPFAVRMVAAGKMNPLHMPRPVKGIGDVRRLYEFSAKLSQQQKEDATHV
jgi:succinate dehydrogenase / fumarate reductase, iron-sulfur subunit